MIFAFLSAIGTAGADIFSKIVLDRRNFPVRKFLPYIFFFLAFLTLFLLPFTSSFNADKFYSFKFIGLFVLMIGSAITWNINFYSSIKKESLHEFELIILLTPITTVVLAAVFYPDERNLGYFIAALIATASLIAGKIRKHHLVLTNNIRRSFTAMLFMAIEVIILKELLTVFSPTLLYFYRTLVLFTIYLFLYKPKLRDYTADKKTSLLMLFCSLFGLSYMIMKYYSFQEIGIVKTTLILLLGPIITYTASYFYFKEHRLFKRDLSSAIIILLCLIYVALK